MPFEPGQSGNPGGRPKADSRLRIAAREHTDIAVGVLAKALADDDARVRIKAAEVLLDRGWGKPHQSIAVANEDGETFKIEKVQRVIVDPRDTDTASL